MVSGYWPGEIVGSDIKPGIVPLFEWNIKTRFEDEHRKASWPNVRQATSNYRNCRSALRKQRSHEVGGFGNDYAVLGFNSANKVGSWVIPRECGVDGLG